MDTVCTSQSIDSSSSYYVPSHDQTPCAPPWSPSLTSTQRPFSHYSYSILEYTPQWDGIDNPHTIDSTCTLHADTVPISTYSSLRPPSPITASESTQHHIASPNATAPAGEYEPISVGQDYPPACYPHVARLSFPTYSERLLTVLHGSERGTSSGADTVAKIPSNEDTGCTLGKRKWRASRAKPENVKPRKSYFKAVAQNVGFTITDPNTINWRDKQRIYLECLEEYVMWLHEQIHLLGHRPLPMERISTYRGLKPRSLRSILVHKQGILYQLNMHRQKAEDEYTVLQHAVLMQLAVGGSLQGGPPHSATTGTTPLHAMPSFVV